MHNTINHERQLNEVEMLLSNICTALFDEEKES
jgi:hypothetical protein